MSKEEVSIKRDRARIVAKWLLLVGAVTLVAVDASAAWDLSAQIGDSIIKPVTKAVKDWVSPVVGAVAAGGLALGTQGDLREKAKISGLGFLGAYGVVELIKLASGI